MIAPLAIDLEILAGGSFFDESSFRQHTSRSDVIRQTRRFDAMKPKLRQAISGQRGDRVRHQTLAGKALTHPIAKGRRRLRNALANVRQLTAADERTGLLVEAEKDMTGTVARRLRVAAQPAAN